MTYEEKVKRIIKEMGKTTYICRSGDVLQRIYSRIYAEPTERELRVINLCDLRFEVDINEPLPLNPTEEWYDIIDFIISLLDGGE